MWLHENHPELFAQAMEYEKEGYSWMDNETLEELIQPERIRTIKLDVLEDAEGLGCAACFV